VKSFIGFILSTIALIAWVIIFQANWKSWGTKGSDMLLIIPQRDISGNWP
jgi:hypothetical protein